MGSASSSSVLDISQSLSVKWVFYIFIVALSQGFYYERFSEKPNENI